MIKPLYDNVLLEKQKEEQETVSGIIISQKPKDEAYAKVIAVCDGKEVDGKLVSIPVKPDDLVLYKKYSGTDVKYEDKDYILISCDDILAIIK